MGTSFVFLFPASSPGRSTGSPAPAKMTSTASSMATFTMSTKLAMATMIFTPRTPWVISLALRISFLNALIFASKKFLKKSGSSMPMAAVLMTPIPP